MSPRTHGHTVGCDQSPEYRAWANMKTRCDGRTEKDFANYAGRGIQVCERWKDSFENFLRDMGKRPSDDHSIDRIDNDGNYEPSNCRWATRRQQMRNMRSNHIIEIDGERKLLVEWQEHFEIKSVTYKRRVSVMGMTPVEALTTPPIRKRKTK